VQQDESAICGGNVSPDGQERLRDFLARHRGADGARRAAHGGSDTSGWYEVYAADGYCLRCDWSRVGGREEWKYAEFGPGAQGDRR
jgi:hypothetical protein